MMKIKTLIRSCRRMALLLIALLATASTAIAYDFEEGGIYYNLNEDGATVTVTHKWTDWDDFNDSLLYVGDVTIPANITFNGTTYTVTIIGSHAFYDCLGLTSINIPNTITTIGSYAFNGCSGLTSITIPYSVTTIGAIAFGNCIGLTSFTLPNSVDTFGEDDFLNPLEGCSGLTNITVEPGNMVYDSRDNCNAIIKTETNTMISGCQATVIPRSVTCILTYAFNGCNNLTSIFIPNTVTSIIGSYDYYLTGLFSGCDNLVSIIVEEGNPNYDSRDNCNAIIETATNTLIAGCGNSIIPNTVTAIGNSAFGGCTSLSSINFPPSIKTIGQYAFGICSVTNLTLGQVDSIAPRAFWYCTQLKHVTIPNSVVVTQSYTAYSWFWYCWELMSVTIGSGMGYMGTMFIHCPNITKVTCLATTPPITDRWATHTDDGHKKIASNFDDEVYGQATLYVPAESVEAYQAARYWKDFQDIRPLGDADGDGALSIGDVTDLIDYLLSGNGYDMDMGAADVDGDGTISIADVTDLIDTILNQ